MQEFVILQLLNSLSAEDQNAMPPLKNLPTKIFVIQTLAELFNNNVL